MAPTTIAVQALTAFCDTRPAPEAVTARYIALYRSSPGS